MDKDIKKQDVEAAGNLPGVAVDIADKNDVNRELVDQETRILNNNPRNNDD